MLDTWLLLSTLLPELCLTMLLGLVVLVLHFVCVVAPGSAIAGLGAGVAGAIVLAAGFVLHIRRVRSQFVEIEISESTPLSSAM